jgi:hypothetical protein
MDYKKFLQNKEKLIIFLAIIAFFLISPIIFIMLFFVGLFIWWMQLEGKIQWK